MDVFPIEKRGASLLVLLGSGGHTGEMLLMLSKVDLSQYARTWVASSGDETSLEKAKNFELGLSKRKDALQGAQYMSLKRARRVGESLKLSVVSTLLSFVDTAKQLVVMKKPDVLLLNGPGTCVPLAYILFALKLVGVCHTRIIYVESLARVSLLSVLGRLVMPIADRFIVPWLQLLVRYRRAEFHGILV